MKIKISLSANDESNKEKPDLAVTLDENKVKEKPDLAVTLDENKAKVSDDQTVPEQKADEKEKVIVDRVVKFDSPVDVDSKTTPVTDNNGIVVSEAVVPLRVPTIKKKEGAVDSVPDSATDVPLDSATDVPPDSATDSEVPPDSEDVPPDSATDSEPDDAPDTEQDTKKVEEPFSKLERAIVQQGNYVFDIAKKLVVPQPTTALVDVGILPQDDVIAIRNEAHELNVLSKLRQVFAEYGVSVENFTEDDLLNVIYNQRVKLETLVDSDMLYTDDTDNTDVIDAYAMDYAYDDYSDDYDVESEEPDSHFNDGYPYDRFLFSKMVKSEFEQTNPISLFDTFNIKRIKQYSRIHRVWLCEDLLAYCFEKRLSANSKWFNIVSCNGKIR